MELLDVPTKLNVLKHMDLLSLIRLSQTSSSYDSLVRSNIVWYPRYLALKKALGLPIDNYETKFNAKDANWYASFVVLWTDLVKYKRRDDGTIMFYRIIDKYGLHHDFRSTALFHISLSNGKIYVLQDDSPDKSVPVYVQFPGMIDTMVNLNDNGREVPLDISLLNYRFINEDFEKVMAKWRKRIPYIAFGVGALVAFAEHAVTFDSWESFGRAMVSNPTATELFQSIQSGLNFTTVGSVTKLAKRAMESFPNLFAELTHIDRVEIVKKVDTKKLPQVDILFTDRTNKKIISTTRIWMSRDYSKETILYEIKGPDDPLLQQCISCNISTGQLYKCSSCMSPTDVYCSVGCQTKHWSEHKKDCL